MASESVLAEQLAKAAEKVTVGNRYRHYKGGLYMVIALAFEESSMEVVVVYQAQYGQKLSFTRPIALWNEVVYWENKQVPRFTIIEK